MYERILVCCTQSQAVNLSGRCRHVYILMNTWNTPPESYQQKVYKNTLATVKRYIQHGENSTPAKVSSTETPRVDNVILLDYLTSEVALEEHDIRSTEANIPIGNDWADDELHCGLPVQCKEYDDEVDQIDDRDAIPTPSR